jgi:cysteine synthase
MDCRADDVFRNHFGPEARAFPVFDGTVANVAAIADWARDFGVQQMPNVAARVVPVGTGGLAAGVGLTIKRARPEVMVIGAEPASSPAITGSAQP